MRFLANATQGPKSRIRQEPSVLINVKWDQFGCWAGSSNMTAKKHEGMKQACSSPILTPVKGVQAEKERTI